MDTIYSQVIGVLVVVVESCGALVIVSGVARAIVAYLRSLFKPSRPLIRDLRLQLGHCMVMGLEFQVAADILKTALSPAWNDVLLLAALVGLRTVLNYLLEFELRSLDGGATGSGVAYDA